MRIVSALLSSVLLLGVGCGGDEGKRQPPPPERKLTTIRITPADSAVELGETVTFSATGVYDDASEEALSAVFWSSNNTGTATIDEAGIASALQPGTTTITATLQEMSGTTTLTVSPAPLVSIMVMPDAVRLEVGETSQLSARGERQDGSFEDLTSVVTWISSASNIASVSTGLVTAVAAGTTTVSARYQGIDSTTSNESCIVTITPVLPESLLVRPANVSLPAGSTEQFNAYATYPDGSEVEILDVVWSTNDSAVATVNAAGLVTAIGRGITSISAEHTLSGIRASGTVSVTPPQIATIEVRPSSATIGVGEHQSFTAWATYTDGSNRDLTNTLEWISSDSIVAPVSSSGRATGNAAGTATISARDPQTGVSSDDSGQSAQLTVLPPTLESIVISPPTMEIPLGTAHQFTATGLFSNQSNQNYSNIVVWSSSSTVTATVDQTGLATSQAVGVTMISAYDPATGISSDDSFHSAELTVRPPDLMAIRVEPSLSTMVVGTTQRFTAIGEYSNATEQDISSTVTWASSGPAVSVDSSGLATGQAIGSVTISATDVASSVSSDDSQRSATVTVSSASLLSIAITTTTATIPVGADFRFTAIGTYDNTATVDITESINWFSSEQTVATIGNAAGSRGIASGLTTGTTTISATDPGTGISSDDSNASAQLAVSAVALVSIAVSPSSPTIFLGDDIAFMATGTYADSSTYDMTTSVQWDSTNSSAAPISNQDGSRGRVQSLALGTSVISAVHLGSGISSATSNENALLTIDPIPCGQSDIRIVELNTGNTDYGAIQNPTTCTLPLNGMQMVFDDSSSSDRTVNFTTQTIGPGATIYITEVLSTPPPDIYAGGNILFDPTRGGTTLLCIGPCTTAANIIDVVGFSGGEAAPAPPAPVTFSPTWMSGSITTNQSYLRIADIGVNPTFLASDWTIGAASH